ncbi:MAG: pirin family protein [Deltaproteobacteria bacterium]|nr:pirin family protein [Deltaproteobacteria bacterium]
MSAVILSRQSLGFPWVTVDPFLFCVHHKDAYPKANEKFGPAVSLAGRSLGQDFSYKDGFSMYHGRVVPGFPQHPHRGFETVTIVRKGYIDHSDSLGATARFGPGDTQWLTAGDGIVHCEMFPLLDREGPNPVELFQIWLNLPAKSKRVAPHFRMLWREEIPELVHRDAQSRATHVNLVAGSLDGHAAPSPPPHSWAADPDNHVAILTLHMEPHAQWTLPAAADPRAKRTLYFFAGDSLTIQDESVRAHGALGVRCDRDVLLTAGAQGCEILLLQGVPIAEPVAQHGPFVMNTAAEIRQAFADYQRTGFGGWPWPSDDPHHGSEALRFAKHIDGRVEQRGK